MMSIRTVVLTAALGLAPGLVLAQSVPGPATPAPGTATGSAVTCPHPTSAAHDQYGCMPVPGGGARRAAIADPTLDPHHRAGRTS